VTGGAGGNDQEQDSCPDVGGYPDGAIA